MPPPPMRRRRAAPAPTLLSLPDDALLRVFHFLPTPARDSDAALDLQHASPSSRAPPPTCSSMAHLAPPRPPALLSSRHAPTLASPAGALAATCARLASLHRTRVVTCVDLARGSCAGGLAAALAAHPCADAAVLDFACAAHTAAAPAAVLHRLRALSLVRVPRSERMAHALLRAAPALEELHIGHGYASTRETAALFRALPLALHRLSVSCGKFVTCPFADCTSCNLDMVLSQPQVHRALWERVATMPALRELRVCNAPAIPREAMLALRASPAMRNLTITCSGTVDIWYMFPADLFLAVPTGLRTFCLESIDPFTHPRLGGYFELPARGFARLPHLETLQLASFGVSWQALRLVAQTLRSLRLFWGRVEPRGIVPCMPLVQELTLNRVDGVDDYLLVKLLSSLPSLRVLRISFEHQHNDPAFAAALHCAAGAPNLRSLTLECSLVNIGDATAAVAGQRFLRLRELDWTSSTVTAVGLTALARGCTSLRKLSLRECTSTKRGIPDPEVWLRDKFPHLTELQLD